MRALFLTALLATVAVPAMAAPQDGRFADRRSNQSDHSDRNSNRAERAQRPARADRPQRVERQAPEARQVDVRQTRQFERVAPTRVVSRPAFAEQRADARQNGWDWNARRNANIAQRQAIRDRQAYARSRTTDQRSNDWTSPTRVESRQQVQTAQRRDRNRTQWTDRDRNDWRGEWRNDRRYDWRDYRSQNRSIFRLGAYFDPFGYNRYRRFDIGFRLQPNYFSSNYWINDPYMYRLPYAPPGYQWIRYYDDAILVDTWSGQVEDVLYNFFW